MIEALRQTKPWVTFLAVLGFIGCSLMVIGGLVMLVSGAAIGGMKGGAIGGALGLVYILMALLYFFPSYYLLQYGGGIKRFMLSRTSPDLESALNSQKSFWRFVGILTAIVMCIYAVVLVVAIVAAASHH